jgi:hypothetical protein
MNGTLALLFMTLLVAEAAAQACRTITTWFIARKSAR